MIPYHIKVSSYTLLGLVFWAWEISRLGKDGLSHVEVSGLNNNSYTSACEAVEHELNAHYR